MDEMSRSAVADELAKLAIAVDKDHVTGVFIVAVHQNGTSSELLVPPLDKARVEKLMLAIDRLHFRAQVACYLKPEAKRAPAGEEKH